MATFTLTIRLGNDAMQTGEDVAEQLTRAAGWLAEYEPDVLDAGKAISILDQNGNRVGQWKIIED